MAQTEIEKNGTLSEDEIYAKAETDKIVRAKSKKKIATMIALCAFMALAVVIILLAAIPVNARPNCISNDFEKVTFYNSSNAVHGVILNNQEEHKEKKEKFLKYFDKVFSQSYISAIFSGALGEYEVSDNINDAFSNAKDKVKDTKYIDIKYSTNQKLTNKNGSNYVSKSKETDEALTFDEVYVVINEENKTQDVTIYLCIDYPETKDRCATIKVKGNTYKLFENWSEFED